MRTQVITPAATTVLDIDEVKVFLRVDIDADDAVIQQMIYAAEEKCQAYIRRVLLPTELGLWFDLGEVYKDMEADEAIHTPKGQLISVDKIATYNVAGEESVIASSEYLVDSVSAQGGRVHFLSSVDGTRKLNSLVIEITAGYADVDSVPVSLVQGMMMLISHWYENREAYEKGTVPSTIRNVWQSERIMRV